MTRKDYILIAKALAASRPPGVDHDRVWENTVRTLALALKQDNQRFEIAHFTLACGERS